MNQKGFSGVFVLVGAILLVAAVGLGYYTGSYQTDKTLRRQFSSKQSDRFFGAEEEESKEVVKQSSSPQSSLDLDLTQTANWKVYTHSKLGFIIKIAPGVKPFFESEDAVVFTTDEEKRITMEQKAPAYRLSLSVYARGDAGTEPLDSLYGECSPPCKEKYEPIQINNALGIHPLGPNYLDKYNYYLTDKAKRGKVVRIFVNTLPPFTESSPETQSYILMLNTLQFKR